jgi:hypothetical protein
MKNLSKVEVSKVFYGYIYPVFAKEFLLGNDYELFALHIGRYFILSPEQWEAVLNEWEIKETILS